jgi:hypothetical protein
MYPHVVSRPASRAKGRVKIFSVFTIRLIGLLTCLSLLMTFLPLTRVSAKRGSAQEQRQDESNGKARRVAAPAARPGPPDGNLPNLQELRDGQRTAPPVAPPRPIPSTMRAQRKSAQTARVTTEDAVRLRTKTSNEASVKVDPASSREALAHQEMFAPSLILWRGHLPLQTTAATMK